MTESTITITKIVSNTIETLTDNYIAIAVITTFLYMSLKQIPVPEALIMMVGFVIKYYFDKKNGSTNNNEK